MLNLIINRNEILKTNYTKQLNIYIAYILCVKYTSLSFLLIYKIIIYNNIYMIHRIYIEYI